MQQTDKTKYEVYELVPGVTCIDDFSDSTSYLIEGEERALLVDTGWGEDNLLEIVRGLTEKPVALALTHVHPDHIRHAARFDKVYMHPADKALLMAEADWEPWVEGATLINDGDSIDLGGVVIEALEIPGHTPGSLVFVDAAHQRVFTGDAIGSGAGVWMQVSHSLPLRGFQRSLQRYLERVAPFGPLVYCGGHIGQCGKPYSKRFNLLSEQVVRDMVALIDRIADGTADKQAFNVPGWNWPEQPYIATLGTASIVYMLSNIEE